MKTEKTRKKLVLNKISIAQLDKDQINDVKSGNDTKPTEYPPQCPSLRHYACATGDECTAT